jgi:hypothetical protein
MRTLEDFLPPVAKLTHAHDMIYKPKNPLKSKGIIKS